MIHNIIHDGFPCDLFQHHAPCQCIQILFKFPKSVGWVSSPPGVMTFGSVCICESHTWEQSFCFYPSPSYWLYSAWAPLILSVLLQTAWFCSFLKLHISHCAETSWPCFIHNWAFGLPSDLGYCTKFCADHRYVYIYIYPYKWMFLVIHTVSLLLVTTPPRSLGDLPGGHLDCE